MKEKDTLAGKFWQKWVEGRDDYEAFSHLYNLYINDLLSYGISLGFSEETCRDAAHDVFFKVFTEKKRLSAVKKTTAYLFRSFRNHLLNIQKRQHRFAPDFTFETYPFTTEITILDNLIDQEEAQRLKNIIKELLEELTPRQREAIYLRYMQEMEYEDIAALLNMNANSARRLVSRGIDNLRNKAINGDQLSFDVWLLWLLFASSKF